MPVANAERYKDNRSGVTNSTSEYLENLFETLGNDSL